MDKARAYIANARKQGKSDDQIKEDLVAAGWLPDQIDQVMYNVKLPPDSGQPIPNTVPKSSPPPSTASPTPPKAPTTGKKTDSQDQTPPPSAQASSTLLAGKKPESQATKSKKIVIILILLTLIMFVSAIIVYLLSSGSSTRPTNETPLTKPMDASPKSINRNLASFVLFGDPQVSTVSAAIPESQIVLYDFTNQTTTPLADLTTQVADTHPVLGPWSPDSRYFPILFVPDESESTPLYLFDLQTQKSSQLIDITNNPEFQPGISSFASYARWVESNNLAFSTQFNPDQDTEVLLQIDTMGNVSQFTRPREYIFGNNQVTVWYLGTKDVQEIENLEVDRIYYKNQRTVAKPKGFVIGSIEDLIITLEEKTATSPSPSLLPSPTTVATATPSAEPDFEPKNKEWLIHLYSLIDGSLKNSYTVPNGWLTVSAKLRHKTNQVIIHQRDNVETPYTSRYIAIDLAKPDDFIEIARIKGDTRALNSFTRTSSFFISQDETWLIVYESSARPQDFPSGKTIVAINIDTLEKLTLCQDACDYLQVYNPNAMRPM